MALQVSNFALPVIGFHALLTEHGSGFIRGILLGQGPGVNTKMRKYGMMDDQVQAGERGSPALAGTGFDEPQEGQKGPGGIRYRICCDASALMDSQKVKKYDFSEVLRSKF
jgi:hypothetical protein